MTAFRIPGCCAFPLAGKVGDTYTCITCGSVYRHLIGGWTLAGPIVDLAPELETAEHPVWHGVEYPYEKTLDENERQGN